MRGTYLELPDDLYRKVKYVAVDEATTLKAIVQRALEEYLKTVKKERR